MNKETNKAKTVFYKQMAVLAVAVVFSYLLFDIYQKKAIIENNQKTIKDQRKSFKERIEKRDGIIETAQELIATQKQYIKFIKESPHSNE